MTIPPAVQRAYEGREAQLFRYAVANGVSTADDVFARAASSGRYSAAELVAKVRTLQDTGRDAELRDLVRRLRPKPFRHLATLLANQPWRPGRESDAATLLEAMVVHGGRDALTGAERLIFLDLLASSGRGADLLKYLGSFDVSDVGLVQAHLLRANAAHPFLTGGEDEYSPGVTAWLGLVNWMFIRDGLEPIGLAPGEEPALDRLLCAPSSLVDDGPLVTIIMPTHNPGTRIATALESLLAQSYRPLEILIMDDGSAADIAARLDAWESRDPRIRVVHLAENRGPYFARNAAASTSRGDFITVHDDDDWSHPRKIELQLAHLLANPDLAANMSLGWRLTPDLRAVRRNYSPKYCHGNFSSLLIRRNVLNRLGNWDLVNRGADGEMRHRLVAVSGARIPIAPRAPMSLLRMSEESLTFGELNRGYIDPRRRWYSMSVRTWHRRTLAEGVEPYLPADDSDCRPFPVPVGMVGLRKAQRPTDVDVLYVTDYRLPFTPVYNEIQILLGSGLTVGMLQLDSPVAGPRPELQARAFDLASHPGAHVLTLKDAARARLTIVRHPAVLQFLAPERAPVSTQRLVLVVDQSHIDPHDGRSALYDPRTVTSRCEAIFGTPTVIAPASVTSRRQLEGLLDPGLFAPDDWPMSIPWPATAPRTTDPSRPPRIGRPSPANPKGWQVAQGAGGTEDFVWTEDSESRPVTEFLAELDFWMCADGGERNEWEALEAIAAGLVVILPESMQATFGEGAVYNTHTKTAATLVHSLWADPAAYRRQSERALSTGRDRFGEAPLRARIDAELAHTAPGLVSPAPRTSPPGATPEPPSLGAAGHARSAV